MNAKLRKKERKKPNRIKWHCFYCSCYISDQLITVILMIFTISQQQLHLSRELKLEQQQSHDNNKKQEGACQNVSVIREKNTEGECTKRIIIKTNTTVYQLEMLLSASSLVDQLVMEMSQILQKSSWNPRWRTQTLLLKVKLKV